MSNTASESTGTSTEVSSLSAPPPAPVSVTPERLNPFSWMDSDERGPEYVSYSQLSDLPACSFDFGNDGYAASCNYGGELLQMTAPSDDHGLLYARGDFEYSLYLALARGQKEKGGKSAFGLKIAPSSELARHGAEPRFRPCCMVERGCFNYRWPFNEFCLHVDRPKPKPTTTDPTSTPPTSIPAAAGISTPVSAPLGPPSSVDPASDADSDKQKAPHCICPADCDDAEVGRDGMVSKPVGTFSVVSYVREGVLYQVMRCSPTPQLGGPETAELVLTVEPPMRLQSFLRLNQQDSKDTEVALKPCVHHESCLSGMLEKGPGSDRSTHWRADLFKLEGGKPTPIMLARLGKEKEKKDHCFKVDDDLDSLPRFQAELEPLSTSADHLFVAAFRLFEDSETQPVMISPTPHTCVSPESISDFIRNGEADAPGTAPLWQATFNDRQDGMDCVSELCEGSVVGRCLEKILRVDLVPAKMPRGGREHFTLVSNMFLKATIDLKSMFWKVRFLVKVDHLLCRKFKDPSTAPGFQCERDYDKPMSKSRIDHTYYKGQDKDMIAAEATIRRIRYVIGEIAAYIVNALLRPEPSPVLLPERHEGDHSHYYAMITLFYLVKHYPEAKWAWQDELKEIEDKARTAQGRSKAEQDKDATKSWGLGILDKRLPKRKDSPLLCSNSTVAKVKYSMLEWLHYESISHLQSLREAQIRIIPGAWQASDSIVKKAQVTAKTELVLRIASVHVDSYRPDDEIADRLAFLAEELLGAEHKTARQITDRIAKRVEEREYTREISLCRPSRVRRGTDDGPWEVHALCHHSRLVVAHKRLCAAVTADAREEAEMEVEHYRKKFYPFLTSEATLMPCWERNNSSARRGFLRSEATAVLASTIIDIFEQDVEYHQPRNTESREPASSERRLSIPAFGGSEAGGDHSTHHDNMSVIAYMRSHAPSRRYNTSSMRHLRRTGERANIEAILIRQLETVEKLANARGQERQINYLEFRPPCRYHPVEFFNSLDDTPELYSNDGIQKREPTIPVVIRQTLDRQIPPEVSSKPMGPREPKKPEKLDKLQALLNTFDEETTVRLRELLVGRIRESQALPSNDPDHPEVLRSDVLEAASLLRQLAVIDLKTPESLETYTPKPMRDEHLVRVVSDSLIDQEVRHRFLLALAPYELPAGLLRLLVFVLHPEMVDCFKNHRIRVSRFALSSRQDTLLMHITLRSWSARPSTRKLDGTTVYNPWSASKEDDKIHLPANLRHHAEVVGRFPKDMQLHVSSIGMSTNAFGDFSKCTIVTSLLPKEQIDEKLGPLAQKIWDNFTHQPQTGRFLVFSLLLGMLTEAIVTNYTKLVDDFLIQTDLEAEEQKELPSYLRDPEDLQTRDADAELRLSLWSLEALAKLSNTVSTSVTTLQEALAEITFACQINSPFAASATGMLNVGGSKLRSAELEAAIHTYLSPLERAFSDLTALQTKLSRKVDLSTRYSNSLSAILALRASRDSYNQNNTIQKLTYLTIGCLPVGLTAAIFAVPTEQDVIAEGTGKGWFIGTVMISFVLIFAVAYWLDWLIGELRRAKDDPKDFVARITGRKKKLAATGTTFYARAP